MIDILLCSLIASLFMNGLKISTEENMILNWLKRGLDEVFITEKETSNADEQIELLQIGIYAPESKEVTISKMYYPILWCIKCMPSIYATLAALLFFPLTVHLFYQVPLVVFCSVTLNAIFFQWYD